MLNIKNNSKDIKEGDTFIAIKGSKVDGHDYIYEAIKRKAGKIVMQKDSYNFETIIVDDTKEYLREELVNNYSKEFEDIKFIGITGTNGKTSTSYITSQMLTQLGINNAYIGTIGYYINSEKVSDLNNTTPNILELYNLILDAKSRGAKYIVMEVSSHSLKEKRIDGIRFDICAFTNLTRDHLDYHKTMENYLNEKKKILDYLKEDGIMVINNDDKYSFNFMKDKYVTIGTGDNTYEINKVSQVDDKTKIVFTKDGRTYITYSNLLGEFNVYNYMLSLAIVNNLKISMMDILRITPSIKAPSGRLEIINVGKAKVIIDYAHTPDAVTKIINAVSEITNGKIITILGCGGDRDKTKRPIMGSIATKGSDHVIFTNDNPRREDEQSIMNQILVGAEDNYEVIFNRKDAIIKGLSYLKDNDTLLILGKGHEEYQIIYDTKVHFSDKEIAMEYARKLKLQ